MPKELVTIFIDDKEVKVPKGTNLIEAAKGAAVEIPHYCYHRHLSVAGNCRMCQVQIEGQPKLAIACNTTAQEGMKVRTHISAPQVAEAQRATLEFLLINHPLDCTVCDQAGHCKLQDYYYEYNSQPSRFVEEKQHNVKAEVLGPDIIYDGERCIVCTRCSRFCEEVTETHELGVFNRGDKSVIGVYEGKQLDNPLAGSVVDLCPVGALTHRRWRFNTRIWYTEEADTICTGCSTGCNAKVATRDGAVVHVKARLNSEVNQEWMCNEGRYGFERFQPEHRLTDPFVRKNGTLTAVSWKEALAAVAELKSAPREELCVLLSPLLTLEELWTAVELTNALGVSKDQVAIQLRSRTLSVVEAKLISPDYAANIRGGSLLGLVEQTHPEWRKRAEERYVTLLDGIRTGKFKRALFIGDHSVADRDLSAELSAAVSRLTLSVALTPCGVEESSKSFAIHQACSVLFPTRTVNEKSGVMLNKADRIQRLKPLLQGPGGSYPEWMVLARIGESLAKPVIGKDVADERSLFKLVCSKLKELNGLTLAKVGAEGIALAAVSATADVGFSAESAGVGA